MRYPILLLLAACSGAFAQVPSPTPVPVPSSLSTAKVIIRQMIGELDAAEKDNTSLQQQIVSMRETKEETQKAALETQNEITQLSAFARIAQDQYQRASIDRDNARMEAHQNAKQRDVFLFTIAAMVTIIGVGYLKGILAALGDPWRIIAWIAAILGIFGITYTIGRMTVAMFAAMIP